MRTTRQRLLPWATVAEQTTLEFIQFGCDLTVALIMELRSATLRRFERLKTRQPPRLPTPALMETQHCPEMFEKVLHNEDSDEVASGAFKHYFLLAGRELLTEDIQLVVRAFRQFRLSNPEFESFRLIVVDGAGCTSRNDTGAAPGNTIGGIENVCWYQLTCGGGEEELSQLYRCCYALIATARPNKAIHVGGRYFGKPFIAFGKATHVDTSDCGYHGLLCDATPEALASSMAQLARDPGSALKIGLRTNHNATFVSRSIAREGV